MTDRRFLILVLLAVAFAGGSMFAGEPEGDGEMTPEMTEMMEMMQTLGAPNEHHEHIARLAGEWKVEGKMWMTPGAEPTVSEGTSSNRMIMGGRFLQSEYDSSFMGQPFHGMGIDGYDNLLQKHIGIWFDSTGTAMMQSVGECSKDGMATTTVTEFVDPRSRELTQMKGTTRIVTDDKYVFEGWNQGPDGEFYKSMELTYTRK
jgi:hypothetical protein